MFSHKESCHFLLFGGGWDASLSSVLAKCASFLFLRWKTVTPFLFRSSNNFTRTSSGKEAQTLKR